MPELTIKIEAPELAHAILELASVLAMAISTEAAKVSIAHQYPGTKDVAPTATDKPPSSPATNQPETTSEEITKATGVVPTVVELRAAAQEKSKTPEGKKEIKALLDRFGSKSISDVPDEKKTDFLAALEAL